MRVPSQRTASGGAPGTRDRIVLTAHDLFYRVGFHAVGLDAILAAVGVTKTTFYNYFESKDQLVAETLRWHDRWWQDTFRQMLRRHGGDAPLGQLRALPEALHELFQREDYNGCFFVNVAVQFPQPHDPAHQAAAMHKQSMEDIIRELAGYANLKDPLSLARELALLMEGAYVTQQVNRSADTTDVVRRMVNLLIDQQVPKAPQATSGPRRR